MHVGWQSNVDRVHRCRYADDNDGGMPLFDEAVSAPASSAEQAYVTSQPASVGDRLQGDIDRPRLPAGFCCLMRPPARWTAAQRTVFWTRCSAWGRAAPPSLSRTACRRPPAATRCACRPASAAQHAVILSSTTSHRGFAVDSPALMASGQPLAAT